MLKRKTASEQIEKTVKRAIDYETTVADLARRSEKRAWRVAGASIFMSFLMLGGIVYLMPHLQKREPYLIMADAYTGTASIARLSEGNEFTRMKASDAVNRSNIVHYVLARESYDSGLISERDWRTVHTMASEDVIKQYTAERHSSNPQSPKVLYGPNNAIRIKILSVTPIGGKSNAPPVGATVRFQRLLFDKRTGATRVLDNKLATMQFTYKPEIKMNDADSAENPLRFQVTNYRVDSDASTLVPTEIPVALPPVMPSGSAPASASSDQAVVSDAAVMNQSIPQPPSDSVLGAPTATPTGVTTQQAQPEAQP